MLLCKVRSRYANGAVVSNVKVEYTNAPSPGEQLTRTTNEKGIAYFQLNVSQGSGDKEFRVINYFAAINALEQTHARSHTLTHAGTHIHIVFLLDSDARAHAHTPSQSLFDSLSPCLYNSFFSSYPLRFPTTAIHVDAYRSIFTVCVCSFRLKRQ